MPAVCSLILVGNSHPNDGGNHAFAEITQESGARPLLQMKWMLPRRSKDTESFRAFKMIPTIENMLDDSILLIAYAICRHPKIFAKVNEMTHDKALNSKKLSMYEDFSKDQRLELYAALKAIDDLPKISWCLFRDSDFKESIIHIKDYLMECEVTQSIYTVEYSNYSKNGMSTEALIKSSTTVFVVLVGYIYNLTTGEVYVVIELDCDY